MVVITTASAILTIMKTIVRMITCTAMVVVDGRIADFMNGSTARAVASS